MTIFIKNQNLKEERAKTKWYRQIKLSIKTLNIAVICLIICSGFFYLLAVNNSAIKGYEIRDLEIKLENAKFDNRKFQLQSRQMQSVDSVEDKINQLGMVNIGQVEYLELSGGVAVAR
ncbi:MAG: hypothetical protein WC480_03365 [Patescibacteria group bacterium]